MDISGSGRCLVYVLEGLGVVAFGAAGEQKVVCGVVVGQYFGSFRNSLPVRFFKVSQELIS